MINIMSSCRNRNPDLKNPLVNATERQVQSFSRIFAHYDCPER